MQNLDYNGLFQYLYAMKYGKECDEKRFSEGVPKAEFEQLMMEYLPVSAQQLEMYEVYDPLGDDAVRSSKNEKNSLGFYNSITISLGM